MGKVDLHSHLVPGVDDGVRSLEEALAALEGLVERGYDRIFTTPHQVDRWRPAADELEARLGELREGLDKRGLAVRLGLGAENYLDEVFIERLRGGGVFSYGLAGRGALVECSPFAPPPFLAQIVFEMRSAGMTPVLAHPERYPWILTGGRAETLRQGGCLFQIDVGSFAGAYGRDARRAAKKLLKADAVDLVASDLHSPAKLEGLVDAGLKALRHLVDYDTFVRLTETVPGDIFEAAWPGPWGR